MSNVMECAFDQFRSTVLILSPPSSFWSPSPLLARHYEKLKCPWLCTRTLQVNTQQQLKHGWVIHTVFLLKTRHSIIPGTMERRKKKTTTFCYSWNQDRVQAWKVGPHEPNVVQQGQVQGIALKQSQISVQTRRTYWEQPFGVFRGSGGCQVCTCSLEGQLYLHCIKKGVAIREREVIVPSGLSLWGLTCSYVSRPGASNKKKMWRCWSRSRGGPQRWSECWSTSPTKKGWGSWACSAWRRESFREISAYPSNS